MRARTMTVMAAMLVATAVAAPAAAADELATILANGTLLEVSAQGRTTRVPDIAIIRAGVVTQAPTAAAALSANAQRMARVLDAVKRAGVQVRDVQTAQVSLNPQYRYEDGKAPAITGYQASNSVAIRFRDIAKSGGILDALVSEGANQIEGPSLSLDKPETALDEARADAIKQARARADLYARAAGLQVARIVSINETGSNDGDLPRPPIMYMARAAAAPAAPTQVAAGETEVTANVSVRFLLK